MLIGHLTNGKTCQFSVIVKSLRTFVEHSDNLRFKLYLAVDHAQAAALAGAQPGPAAAVQQRVGHDDRGLVVGEHAAVLLHVRENAEVHKQSEASVRHSAPASAQQLGVLELQLEQAAVESLLGDEDAAAAGEDAVPDNAV